MADSSSFSSLFDLVDSHLSKSNLQQDCQPSTSGLGSMRLPPFSINRGASDTKLPSSSIMFPMPSTSKHPINDVLSTQLANMLHTNEPGPSCLQRTTELSMTDSPINDVLAMQISNMFKAKQAKEEEKRKLEQQKAEEDLRASCMIDLMPAIQQPIQFQQENIEIDSADGSMESLVIPDITDNVPDNLQEVPDLAVAGPSRAISPWEPIMTDMSHILDHKMARCSHFGKVLCARYRTVAAPYFRVRIRNKNIKTFDFSTPSPDDIVRERLRRPNYYNNSHNTLSIFD